MQMKRKTHVAAAFFAQRMKRTITRPWRLAYATLGAVTCLLLLRRATSRGASGESEVMAIRAGSPAPSLYSMEPPDASALQKRIDPAGTRALFILAKSENRCTWRYNYFCKFFFAIRCYMVAGFRDVRVMDTVDEVLGSAKLGDVVLIVHRSKIHAEPHDLVELNAWRARETTGAAEALRKTLRIGVFHVSNEVERDNWPWYVNADFVLRNYWIDPMPAHALYIPLGHQMPSYCAPETPRGWGGGGGGGQRWLLPFLRAVPKTCSCGGRTFRAGSQRPHLWAFSGSLRKRRAALLRRIRGSAALRGRGQLLVAKAFGGDGAIGSGGRGDPKQAHVQAMLDAAFVFAPCGNVMETHRIYEALALGAIPVIEDCEPAATSAFFPLRRLVVPGGPDAMVAFVEAFVGHPEKLDALQRDVAKWWKSYAAQLAEDAARTILQPVPRSAIVAP